MNEPSTLPEIGAPCPGGELRAPNGATFAVPTEGTIVFLRGAFAPGSADACAALPADTWVILPDAPAVAAAWAAALGLDNPVGCDDRPRGAVARAWGAEGSEGVGRAFTLAAGRVVATAVVEGRASAADAPPALTPAAPAGHEPEPGGAPAAPREAPSSPPKVARVGARASSRRPPPPPRWGLGAAVLAAGIGAAVVFVRADGDPAPEAASAGNGAAAPVPAPSGPLPPAPVADPSGVNLGVSPFAVPNPDLRADTGAALGFGDKVAGNGHPDGWFAKVNAGDVKVTPEGTGVRFTYETGAKVAFASQPQDVAEGEALEVRFTFDPGERRSHGGQVGVAFFTGRAYLEQATRDLLVESDGPQTMVLRATAPAGANKVQLRWAFDNVKEGGAFAVSDLSFTHSHPRSTARFPLPHVLLVTIETLRNDHTGLGGYVRDTTPNLVKLAGEGARFDNHYVQAPYTRPSLSSLVSGQYPAQTGVEDNVAMLPESAVTVAERFADHGYLTSAFLAQYLLNQDFGFNQGFQFFVNFRNDTPADQPFDRLKGWLADHEADNTFTWMHLFDPHGPYRPPAEVQDTFVGDATWNADKVKVPVGKGAQRGQVIPDYVYDEGQTERRHYVARYDADILYADRAVGQLVEWLKAEKLDQDTLLVVTADHGESMTDHDKYFAHGSLWQNDIHVPLVVWAPGRVSAGKVVEPLSQHVDLVPTLLDYAGIPAVGLPGASLRATIESGASPHAFTVTNGADRRVRYEAVVRPDGFKVILSEAGEPLRAYDVHADPGEAHDLLATRKADAETLAAAYRASLAAAPAAAVRPSRELGDDEKAKLEALGYTEGDGAP